MRCFPCNGTAENVSANCTKHNAAKSDCLFHTCSSFVCMTVYICYSRNHRQTKTAEVKATRDLEMASEGPSRSIPLPQGHDNVYAIAEVPIQRNPSYGMVK